jgi:hypothetical protein
MRWNASSPPQAETITIGMEKTKQVDITYFPKAETIVEEINGTRNVRYFERATAVVGDRWFAVSFYNLATVAWNGSAWESLVDEAGGEAVFGKSDARVDALATDGTRAWAVSTGGAVYEWAGKAWDTRVKAGGALFEKPRRFTRLAWDSSRERLVLWGGNNGTRSSNDTLLFEAGTWRKSGKPGTKLASRKADNYWMYDDRARGGVVRIGPDGCHLLDGDAWKPLELTAPGFVTGDDKKQASQIIIACDPASKQTLWIDPHTGAVYREGGDKIADVGVPPGMVTTEALREAGGYFGDDFARVNGREWMWAWDPAKRRAFGTVLGSTRYVCDLDLGAAF